MKELSPSQIAKLKIRKWKENLLDISKKSGQLRPSLNSLVEIIHPDSDTFFRVLVIYGQPCVFIPVYRGRSRKTKSPSIEEKNEDSPSKDSLSKKTLSKKSRNRRSSSQPNEDPKEAQWKEFLLKTYKLEGKHIESLIKKKRAAKLADILTPLSDKSLQTRLKKFIQKAKESEEELGITILYVTFGLLNWIDPDEPETLISTPVLFVPVKIDKNEKGHYELKILSDDVFLNPALKTKLLEFRVSLPEFPEEFDSSDVRLFWNEFMDAIRFERNWSLEDRSFIGTFSFSKISLFDEIEKHEEEILQHPIIKAMAERSGYIEKKENLPTEKELAELENPLTSYCIMDADSSQSEAILYVKKGTSIVIQGPPGTGKSQCISNIIAECLALNKKVLFVAQKQAALTVVKKRLEQCGLGEFCLILHSQNANKSSVLSQIEESMDFESPHFNLRMESYHELNLTLEKLNEYVQLINEPQGKRKLSLHQIMGFLLYLKDVPFIECNLRDPAKVSDKEFSEICDYLQQLEGFRDSLEHYSDNPWTHAKITNPLLISNHLIPFMKRVLTEIETALSHLKNSLSYYLNETNKDPSLDSGSLQTHTENEPSPLISSLNFSNLHTRDSKESPSSSGDTTTKWDIQIRKGLYVRFILEKLIDHWLVVSRDYTELTNYFVLDEIVPFHIFSTYFSPLKQIQIAFGEEFEKELMKKDGKSKKEFENVSLGKDPSGEGKFSSKEKPSPPPKTLGQYLLRKVSSYLKLVEDFNNRLKVFNIKSSLAPLLSERDLYEFKSFFDTFYPKALAIDSNLLLARFTTEYVGALKRRRAEFKQERDLIYSVVRDPDTKVDPIHYLSRIKAFQDRYGSLLTSSETFIENLYKEFMTLYSQWQSFHHLEEFLFPLFSIKKLPKTPIKEDVWESFLSFCREWKKNLPELNNWFEIEVRRYRLEDLGAGDFFQHIIDKTWVYPHSSPDANKKVPYSKLFEKAFYQTWKDDLFEALPPIKNFDDSLHETNRTRFQTLDSEILYMNRFRLLSLLMERRSFSDIEVPPSLLTQMGLVKRELKKKRNVMSLRKLFTEAREYITLLKPVFMMSPLSISNYLPIDSYKQYFDIVIFDEASQVTPEDAIGAIFRAKSLVVVGDSKQMPPTSFFTAIRQETTLDDYEEALQNMESLLDECTGIGLREKMLKFHYRSKKEGLIAFSNRHYYKGKLYTFPDLRRTSLSVSSSQNSLTQNKIQNLSSQKNQEIEDDLPDYGSMIDLPAVEFKYVPKGRKVRGKNPIEAEEVAKYIIKHYLANKKYNTSFSLGVIAFSQAQQNTIQEALAKLLKKYPDLESLIYEGNLEPLFIKNLENAQGDERDVIYFSVGYAKDASGKLTQNFGPLNKSGGYRRLNVAITRARYHIKLFASFLPGEFNYDNIHAEGLRDLIDYMIYARTGKIPLRKNLKVPESVIIKETIENDIKSSLLKEGYIIDTNIGTSSFKIDFAIVDPNNPKRYLLAIECDAGSYKDAVMARDRDRIRPMVLQTLGWKVMHIWTPTWFMNKQKILKKIRNLIETSQK